MVLEQPVTDNRDMTSDDVLMDRSKSFVKALQELKNLKPQLYSAAEYCERSYLQGENKQMVLDNLKDYAVRAIVNAVDHIGTVTYKLTDVVEQQSLDIKVMELKYNALNQRFLTCQTLTDKEGLRQQQLLANTPRHHKHYTLPKCGNKKVYFGPQTSSDARKNLIRPRLQQSGTNAAKTLSWHLASEAKASSKGRKHSLTGLQTPGKMQVFQLLNDEDNAQSGSLVAPQIPRRKFSSFDSVGVARQDSTGVPRPMISFHSFDNPNSRAIIQPPVRSKSLISALFAKQKTPKLMSGPS